ncbi:MAG: hypothetical protein CMP18_02875 [Rickettsiales bacterium]|nr:hypothetical protein [Rickettsiales bacterium]
MLHYDSDEEWEGNPSEELFFNDHLVMIEEDKPDFLKCCIRGSGGVEFKKDELRDLCQALSNNTALSKFELSGYDLGNEGFCILLESLVVNTTLNDLRLKESGIVVEKGAKFLELMAKNKNILSLDLRDNYAKDVEEVIKLINPTLKSINLGSCFGARGNVSKFLKNLIENKASLQKLSLQHIGLDKNLIGLEESALVAKLILEAGLKKINLGFNKIGDDAFIELVKALNDKKCILEKLDLCYNKIGLKGAKALLDHLSKNNDISLRTLSLNSNDLGCEGAVTILQLRKLKHLNLRQVMDDISVTSNFADVLSSNKDLETLNLSQNKITDEGVDQVVKGLDGNENLKELIINGNLIGDKGAENIANMLKKNTSLIHIDLFFNKQIGDEGVKKLADALKNNTTLQKLNLNCVDMGVGAFKALSQALEDNTTLMDLNLEGIEIKKEEEISIEESKESIRISLVRNKIIQAINELIYKDVYDIDEIDKKKIRELVIEIAQGQDELKAIRSLCQFVNCSKEMQGVFTLGGENPAKTDSQNEYLSLSPELKVKIIYNLLPKELKKIFSTNELKEGKTSQTQNDYKLKQLCCFLYNIFQQKDPSATVEKPTKYELGEKEVESSSKLLSLH